RRGPRRCTRPIRRAPAPAEGAPTRRERPPPVSETRRAPRDHGAAYVEHPARDCLPAMSAGPGPANRPKSPLTERSANGRRGSWSEVEFDAVAGWLDAGVVVEAGGVGASEVSDDVGEFGEGVEFLVEGVESSGGFGVVGQPGVAFSSGVVELVPSGVEVVDGLVEAAGFGGDGPGVGGFGGGFLVGPVGGFFAPVAAVSPGGGGLGVVLGFPVLPAGVEEPAGGGAFGGVGVAALAGKQIGVLAAQGGEFLIDPCQVGGGIDRNGGGDGVPFGLEAGVAQSGSHAGGGLVVVFDGEGFGGGGAGVDGPAGPVVDGPVAGEVFGGLVDVVGDD